MKKALISVVIVVLVAVMLLTLTACNKYKWNAVGTTEYSSEEAVGNGSLVVKQGGYLYFVNNVADTSSLTKDDNEWGANGSNGAIIKSKINEDGTLETLGVVVPKIFAPSYSDAGIYVYGEWIYYAARSQKTDNKGNLISALEFLRTKTDGTKTQSLAIVEDTSTTYIFTKTGLLYTKDSNIYYVDYSGKKIKDAATVVEEYTDLVVSEEDLCMFYTKASDDEYVMGNNLGVVLADGSNKIIISESAYAPEGVNYKTNPSTLFTLDIIAYNAADNSIYYTKTCKDNDAKVFTIGYAIPEDYSFNKDNEIAFAKKALSSIYSLGINVGIVDVSSSTIVSYAKMTDPALEVKSEELALSAQITVLYEKDGYTYYLESSKLYRANLFVDGKVNKNAYEEKISDVSFGSKYGKPVLIADYLYYESSDDATYLSRIKMAYDSTTQAYLKGYIVSGYKAYTYPDDADYVVNKDDESIKDKVPAYMTDSDLETYVSNHKTTNE